MAAGRALDSASPGIGLRAPHYAQILERRPALGFLEVHSENFFCDGGPALAWLERFARDYALSFHGVGLSLGSADPLDERHLGRLSALVRRFEPLRDLLRNRQRLGEGDRSTRDSLRQILALDEFHHQRTDTVRFFETVDVGDVGMIE